MRGEKMQRDRDGRNVDSVASGGRLSIRDARDVDMPAVQSIYAHYVRQSLATFEETPPTVEEMLARRTLVVDACFPYLVAELDDAIVGYCYASAIKEEVEVFDLGLEAGRHEATEILR